jgi:transposase
MDAASAALDLDGLDVAELKALLLAKDSELIATRSLIASKDELLRAHALEIQALKLHILKLKQLQFGKRSEKRERQIEQLELRLEELETAQALCAPIVERLADYRSSPIRARKPRRQFPAHLPRELRLIAALHVDCPQCHGAFTQLGEDVSETIELEPLRFKVVRTVRPKLACTNCDAIVQAPAPSAPIERGMAGPALLAHIIVSKYGDHLPLYRQAEIYAREGVDLDRSLLAQWVGQVSALVEPLTRTLQRHVMAADVVHADDTPINVLAPGLGKTKTGRLWTYVRDERPSGGTVAPAVWFSYSPDRKGEHPQRHLEGWRGVLQADGYAGFTRLYDSGRVIEAACWAHVRRKFVDLDAIHKSELAGKVLDHIGELYAIEQRIRGSSPHERCSERGLHSRPILDALRSLLTAALQTLSQKSEMAKAIRYALGRWEALCRFCDDGRIEIDNNAAERSLRCVALGRKNFLFAGSDAGGDRAAAFYSLLGTAKLNDCNPQAYLRYVLERVADFPMNDIEALLPWNIHELGILQIAAQPATPALKP